MAIFDKPPQFSSPDHGVVPGQLPALGFDQAELAARLGSISRVHRDGRLVWDEGFNVSLTGWNSLEPANGTNRIVGNDGAYYPYEGSGCLRQWPTAANNTCVVSRNMPMFGNRRLGFEVSYLSGSVTGEVILGVFGRINDVIRFGWVRMDFDADQLQYRNNLGTYTTFAQIDDGLSEGNWNNVKLVVDLDTAIMERVYWNEQVFIIRAPIYQLADAGGSFTELSLRTTYPVGGSGTRVYFDNLILTIDEA